MPYVASYHGVLHGRHIRLESTALLLCEHTYMNVSDSHTHMHNSQLKIAFNSLSLAVLIELQISQI